MLTEAYRITELAEKGPIARSTLFRHAARGLLVTRRIAGVTVVLGDDWRRYLSGRQRAAPAAAK